MPWKFIQLDDKVDISTFDCGTLALNLYLSRYALESQRSGYGTTYVAVEEGNMVACGFITLSNAGIRFESMSTRTAKSPRYPLSAIRLARLAVDTKHKGKKLGAALMRLSFELFSEQCKKIRSVALLVDAKDDDGIRFYQKYGFIPFRDAPKSLFLPAETIEQAIQGK